MRTNASKKTAYKGWSFREQANYWKKITIGSIEIKPVTKIKASWRWIEHV